MFPMVRAFLPVGLVAGLLGGPALAQTAKKPDADTITITGTLIDKNGSPVEGKKACLIATQNGKLFVPMRVNKAGQIELTSSLSDAKGRFSIVAGRQTELGLGICEGDVLKGGGLRLKKLVERVPVAGKSTVDLGKIVAP